MKLSKGLFLAFAGLGLFACSNEDVTTDATVDDGKSKTMVISLNGISEGSRATSAAEAGDVVTLNKVAIFYTTATGSVGHVTTLTSGSDGWDDLRESGYVEHSLPASIEQVYVVGNYDNLLGDLNAIGTANILKEKVINASTQQDFDNVVLFGEDTTLDPVVGGDGTHEQNVVKADLTISPLVSRLEISGIKCNNLGTQYSSIDLKKTLIPQHYYKYNFLST